LLDAPQDGCGWLPLTTSRDESRAGVSNARERVRCVERERELGAGQHVAIAQWGHQRSIALKRHYAEYGADNCDRSTVLQFHDDLGAAHPLAGEPREAVGIRETEHSVERRARKTEQSVVPIEQELSDGHAHRGLRCLDYPNSVTSRTETASGVRRRARAVCSTALSDAETSLESISEPAISALIARGDIEYVVAKDAIVGSLAAAGGMKNDGTLMHLFVETSHQHKGLGRKLWEFLRDRNIHAGHSVPFTVKSSLQSVPVYERFGFIVAGACVE